MIRGVMDGAPQTSPAGVSPRSALGLPWLVGWRWWAIVGQLATVMVVAFGLDVTLPLARVLPLIAGTAATNVAVVLLVSRAGVVLHPWTGGALLSLDTVVLTALLAITGGAANPFSILYLVHIALSAVILGRRWTWFLTALSVGCYGALFFATDGGHMHAHEAGFSLHLQGMWIAFAVAAVLTAYFVTSLADAVDRRDAEIADLRELAARNERLASLTTLAAGAAHALGSPLGTIAVAAKELERALAKLESGAAAGLAGDAQLIRAEVERCRRILARMASDAGESAGEAPAVLDARDIVADVRAELSSSEIARVVVAPTIPAAAVSVPRRALAQAVSNLVRNGLDATAPAGTVSLSIDASNGGMRIAVTDAGVGMAADVMRRAGEPFYTTKPEGKGLGLGLFLAKSLAESLGGRLSIVSDPRRGTSATMELPRHLAR
jgi:two-component system sensor histidine kinase RegB